MTANVVYIPALILNTFTGYSVNLIVLFLNLCCLLYTALGGINAVIYTDFIQALVLVIFVVISVVKMVTPIGIKLLFESMVGLIKTFQNFYRCYYKRGNSHAFKRTQPRILVHYLNYFGQKLCNFFEVNPL